MEIWSWRFQSFYTSKQYKNFYLQHENHRKKLIHYCERSELRLHIEWTKANKKCQNMVHFREFLKN